ncbi:MAG: aspartate-semialdehyde dehydrogenase [Flavobacteriales bacterium]|jgi:aspartate-semialdehyde dehydrogenase|tara:strand:+ start:18197 stop:19180 length:984 start_codon:yes stop_codon:yes gene_type:complete
MKVAVIGSTGMVGKVMLEVLQERRFPVSQLIPVSSSKSVGKQVLFNGKEITIVSMEDALASKPDIALFSAGGDVSLEWAPKFAEAGTKVIDNSSAWRMNKALIVPEINGSSLTNEDVIIANPNCSTIQLVMALKPLHDQYKINRIVVSTYQSITGTGVKAVQQLQNEINQEKGEMAYPYPIHENALPHCDVFEENGYTKEEMKLVKETKKILGDNSLNITATAVRVPVKGGHSESVNVSFENDFELTNVRKLLNDMPGVIVQDNPDVNTYPMPIYAHGKDDVFVGRIRRDFSQPKTLNMWVVADNLRKGAATNAVQIAQYLKSNQLI